jgi:hypothetical protein
MFTLKSLPQELLSIVLNHAVDSSVSSVLQYRATDRYSYDAGTLAIFQGNAREAQVSLLKHWLTTPAKRFNQFIHHHTQSMVEYLNKNIQDVKATIAERFIFIFSLKKISEPAFELPVEQIINSANFKKENWKLTEDELTILALAYRARPETVETSLFSLNPALAILIKSQYQNVITIDPNLLTQLATSLVLVCSKVHFYDASTALSFHKILPHLSAENKDFIYQRLLKAKTQAEEKGSVYVRHFFETLELILKHDSNSEKITDWLISHAADHNEAPFTGILLEKICDQDAERLLNVIAEFNYDYWSREVKAENTRSLFYDLLPRVTEDKRVEVLINILKQDFRSTAGYSEYMPRYLARFFDGIITAPANIKKIADYLINLPDTTEEERFEKVTRLMAFIVHTPDIPFTLDTVDISVVLARITIGKRDKITVECFNRIVDAVSINAFAFEDPLILNLFPLLVKDELKKKIFDDLLKVDDLSLLKSLPSDTVSRVRALIPYQKYFNQEQNGKLLKLLFFSTDHLFSADLMKNYRSFTPEFQNIMVSHLLSKPSLSSHCNSLELIGSLLAIPELCTQENYALIHEHAPKGELGTLLLQGTIKQSQRVTL